MYKKEHLDMLRGLRKTYITLESENTDLVFDYESLTIVGVSKAHINALHFIEDYKKYDEQEIATSLKAYQDILKLVEKGLFYLVLPWI